MAQYEIALFTDPRLQVMLRKSKNAWGIRYKVRRKGETMYKTEWKQIEATSRIEAVKEAEEFYLRALTNGACWIEDTGKKKRPLKRPFQTHNVHVEDRDKFIHAYTIEEIRYRVKVDGILLKAGFASIEDARRFRDDYLRGGAKLKVCKTCGVIPVWVGHGETGSASLTHKEPGCPNRIHIGNRTMDAVAKIFAWNDHFSDGSKPGWGNVTAEDLLKLGVFAKLSKSVRRRSGRVKSLGGKVKIKEEQVFDDFIGISDDEV